MIQTIRNAWAVPELRKKILFTIFALLIFRLGSAIPVPYINSELLALQLESQSGTILGLMNAMSGSAFSMATVFALSIQPYINSSIIIQLLTVAIPALERLAKEGGEEGRKKIASITRYTTVAIALLQGFGYYSLIKSYGLISGGTLPAVWVGIVIVLSFTAGSAFLMWLGEQITEFGIGNGISIILFAGIVSRFPQMISDCVRGVNVWNQVKSGSITAEMIQQSNPTVYKTVEDAQTYLDQLDQITPQQPQAEQPAQTDAVDQAVSDIDDSVQRLVAKAMAEAKEENEKARQGQDLSDTAEFPAQGGQEPEHDDMEQTTRIDFGELQFGRDYEIK